jgi:hypothetical protein
VVLGAVGLGVLAWRSPALAVRALIGFVPLLPLFYRGAPKLLLPIVPGMVLCLAQGLETACFPSGPPRRLWVVRMAVVVLALAPWLIGRVVKSDRDRTIDIARMSPAWADGFAVATPEGPRPVGAYGAALFGGRWRALVNELEVERRRVIERAVALGQPVLQDDGNSLIVVHLLGLGYTTQDPRKRFQHGYNERTFATAGAHRVRVWQLQERPALFEAEQVRRIIAHGGADRVVFYSNYSSSLQKLFRVAPDAAEVLGPFSALVDLRLLARDLEARERRDGSVL